MGFMPLVMRRAQLPGVVFACWGVFFLSPLFFPQVPSNYIAIDLLALATGLLAASFMPGRQMLGFGQEAWKAPWLFLLLLLLPAALLLASEELARPWDAWRIMLYICCAWLVYRLSGQRARSLLGSQYWAALLGIVGCFYVMVAVGETFRIPFPFGNELFPLWIDGLPLFGGVLIQTNQQGLFLALVVVALWSRVVLHRCSWLWALASILPCAGLFATASRSSLLVLLAGVFAILLAGRSWRHLPMLIVSIIAAYLLNEYWSVLQQLSETKMAHRLGFVGSALEDRRFLWSIAANLFSQHPYLGIGWGNLPAHSVVAQLPVLLQHPEWGYYASLYLGGHAWAHNIILQGLVGGGLLAGGALLGLCLLVGYKLLFMLLRTTRVTSGKFQGVLGSAMMLAHGQVSVAVLQGYFLVLLGLYLAAAFGRSPRKGAKPATVPAHQLLRLASFAAAGLVFVLWGNFISVGQMINKATKLPITSEGFVQDMALGMDDPWLHGDALHEYFAALLKQHAAPRIWVNSEHLAHAYWNYYQNQWSLKFLILIAHLKGDVVMEERLIKLFVSAYPKAAGSPYFIRHAKQGHAQGEAINIWL